MSTASTCGSVFLPDEVPCERIRFRLPDLVSVEIVIHILSFCDVVFSGASRDHRHIMPFYEGFSLIIWSSFSKRKSDNQFAFLKVKD